jgi:predicted ester cyclase
MFRTFVSLMVAFMIQYGKKCVDENVANAHCMLGTSGYKYSDYVIFSAFPLQHWLHERAAMLR